MPGGILRISDAAVIGVHALMVLAQNSDKLISVKDIASELNVSANHLSKVMQRLNKAGFIDSIKGYKGGFKLIRKPQEITFLEIYELFDGKIKEAKCLLSEKRCTGECALGDFIPSVNAQIKEKFENTTLAVFLR